jgi:hypothetical protein
LTITEEQKGGSGDHATTRHYITDGMPATFEEDGATVVATAAWEGDVLVIKANADAGGTIIAFIERTVAHNERRISTELFDFSSKSLMLYVLSRKMDRQ